MADTGYFTAGITYSPAIGVPTDLEFGAVDTNGTAWMIRGWQGMGADGVATSGQVVQRGGDHGTFATPQWYGSRTITLTVHATARSSALRDVARAYLQQAIPVGSGGPNDLALLRWDEPVPVQMAVRQNGPPVETRMTLTDVEWSVLLVAPDPRRYSTVLHQVSVVTGALPAGLAPPLTPPLHLPAGAPPMEVSATNAGSFSTGPFVTIYGPVVAPGVVNLLTGQQVKYSALTLAAGDVLVIDFLNKTATYNGVYRTADVASSWSMLLPGVPTTYQMLGTPSGSASMTVSWRDAWI
jgi:hypothetical protein